jgi:malate synthase
VAIFNLMEDAATAEISRSQVWQWLRFGVRVKEGLLVSRELITTTIEQELERIRQTIGDEAYESSRFPEARQLFEQVTLEKELPDFLTLPAYEHL